jgi:hypothetical protein
VTRDDLADLFWRMAERHGGRPPTAVDLTMWINTWSGPALRGGWTHAVVVRAIEWFYDGDPIRWVDGPYVGTPRPILPCDIDAFAALQGIP